MVILNTFCICPHPQAIFPDFEFAATSSTGLGECDGSEALLAAGLPSSEAHLSKG